MAGAGVRPRRTWRSRASEVLTGPAPWSDTVRKDAVAGALTGVYTGVLGPFVALVAAKSLHAPVLLLSLMMCAPFLGNMATPFWAHRLHGKPKLPFVVIPAILARSLYLLMIVVRRAEAFVAVTMIAQMLEASSGPAYSAVMERVYPKTKRGRLMSLVRVVRTLVVIGVTLLAGHIIDRWGYHQVFFAAAAFGIAGSCVFSRVRVPPAGDEFERQHEAASPRATWAIFRTDSAYRQFTTAIFAYGMGNLLLGPVYPIFAANVLKISYAQQGTLAFITGFAAILGFIGWGHYIDRVGSVKCVIGCIAVVALKPMIWYFARSYAWLVPSAFLDGISNAGIELGYLNCILSFSPPERVPSYQSLHATLLGVRGVLAPFLAGGLVTILDAHNLSIRLTFLVSAAMILIGLAMCSRVRTPGHGTADHV